MAKRILVLLATGVVVAVIGLFQAGAPTQVRGSHDLPCTDVDGNGTVTITDLNLAADLFFGDSPTPGTGGDVDGNGFVAVPDLFAIIIDLGLETDCQDAPAHNPAAFPGQGDDVFPSLGKFRIVVSEDFRADFAGCPAPIWDGDSRLESPTLSDAATKVGRSAVHQDGDVSDTGGTAVGTAGTVISDSSFSLVPAGFEGPAGRNEIHTEVRALNLAAGGAAVRAGTAAPGRPVSPGEVEAATGGGDFPADSFFDVFVEVDVPPCGGFPGATLHNTEPLIVANSKLELLPPKVVYVHANPVAVPILFLTANPPDWDAGDLFGHLVIAGHGANFDVNDAGDVNLFETFVEQPGNLPELPLPSGVGGIAEFPDVASAPLDAEGSSGLGAGVVAGIVAAVTAGALALGSAAWYVRKRSSQ